MSRVVLLHAYPCDGSLWDEVAQGLRADGHEVTTPHLRGFAGTGLGDDPPDMERLADDAIALVESGPTPAFLGGCSIGGYISLAVARRRPDLVQGLILADTKATADAPAAQDNRERVAHLADTGGDWTAGLIDNLLGVSTRAAKPDVVARTQEWMAAAPRATVAWMQRAMAGRSDSVEMLRALSRPVLVICGSEDALSAGEEQQIMVDASGGEFVEIVGAGHLTPIEAPDDVLAAIRAWLPTG